MAMRDDPEFNIRFCEEVQKFPCLYDYTRTDYSNRIAQDRAWATIAEVVSERVAACRDRWKNIRGRYVKTKTVRYTGTGARRIKEYYLTPHIRFVDAFLKPRRKNTDVVNDSLPEQGIDDNLVECFKEEEEDNDDEEEEEDEGGYPLSGNSESAGQSIKPTAGRTNRKRKCAGLPAVNEPSCKRFDEIQQSLQDALIPHYSVAADPDMSFLQSLLPDMKLMTESKKRKFKMGILQLAHQLLDAT